MQNELSIGGIRGRTLINILLILSLISLILGSFLEGLTRLNYNCQDEIFLLYSTQNNTKIKTQLEKTNATILNFEEYLVSKPQNITLILDLSKSDFNKTNLNPELEKTLSYLNLSTFRHVGAIELGQLYLAQQGFLKSKKATVWSGPFAKPPLLLLINSGAMFVGDNIVTHKNLTTASSARFTKEFLREITQKVCKKPKS